MIEHDTLRVGDILRGPHGGFREITAWDDKEMRTIEAWAHHEGAPAPTAGRGLHVRVGSKHRARWMSLTSFLIWLRRAERTYHGAGMPWPYIQCSTCNGIGLYAALRILPCPDCKGKSWEAAGKVVTATSYFHPP